MDKQRMDAYIRVSAVKGRSGPSYISPTAQREAIERWAAFQDIEIDLWHVDEDSSGGTQDRPKLQHAIERAIAGETNGIVSATIDRFSRFTEGGLRDLRRLQAAGARLAFVAGNDTIDTSGPTGKAMFTMLLVMSELVLENIKANWIVAKTRAIARGAYISRTPFGYERLPDGTIALHPTEAPLLREAYRRAATEGLHAAVAYLAERSHDHIWTTATTRRTLARRVYLGETRIGQFLAEGTHDALVSPATWQCAQSEHVGRVAAEAFPLSGLAHCGNCGAPMIGGHGGKGSLTRIYRCSATTANRAKGLEPCARGVVITAERLERYVREQAEALVAGIRGTVGDADSELEARLAGEAADAEEELEAFATEERFRRTLRAEVYDRLLESRVTSVETARAALREHARKAEAKKILRGEALVSATFPTLVRGLFESIVISPGRGVTVERRVQLIPLDRDDTAGVAAA